MLQSIRASFGIESEVIVLLHSDISFAVCFFPSFVRCLIPASCQLPVASHMQATKHGRSTDTHQSHSRINSTIWHGLSLNPQYKQFELGDTVSSLSNSRMLSLKAEPGDTPKSSGPSEVSRHSHGFSYRISGFSVPLGMALFSPPVTVSQAKFQGSIPLQAPLSNKASHISKWLGVHNKLI